MPAALDYLLVLTAILCAGGFLFLRSIKRKGCDGCGASDRISRSSQKLQIKLPHRR